MKNMNLPAYPKRKMKGNIGEALAQYVLSKFCLVHKIDGSNDIGNDLICELIRDESPTNLLFYVQVKYSNKNPQIRKETLEYWKDSPVPVYLFWIKDKNPTPIYSSDNFSELEKYYKRYTPILHNPQKHSSEKFKLYEELQFKRDLIIDYSRTQFFKGYAPIIEPRDFLNMNEKMKLEFRQYVFYIKDVIPEYSKQILSQSWLHIFTSAVLLFLRGDIQSLQQAKGSIAMAKKYLKYADEKKVFIFEETLNVYESKINEAIQVLNANKK
ncbi:DUF4365 domain-containing protein [Candidatus Collierbacteria bacterium]|nr:DUF4365 domain-containing protein [Candidatus Collierbacteria bacterium]